MHQCKTRFEISFRLFPSPEHTMKGIKRKTHKAESEQKWMHCDLFVILRNRHLHTHAQPIYTRKRGCKWKRKCMLNTTNSFPLLFCFHISLYVVSAYFERTKWDMMRFILFFFFFVVVGGGVTTCQPLVCAVWFQSLEGLSCSFCGKFHTSLKRCAHGTTKCDARHDGTTHRAKSVKNLQLIILIVSFLYLFNSERI